MKYQLAILCAGQGAQTVGMGRELAASFPGCRALFAKADEILGYELQKIIFEGPENELVKSNHCQPAIFTVTIACFQALQFEISNLSFQAAAGLSLGEWSALCLAGAISFEDGLRALEARGRYMQEACEEQEGAMLSVIGLKHETLLKAAADSGVEIANYNSSEQTVLSGRRPNIAEAEKMMGAAGARRVMLLNVAGAYHSSLMKSAAEKMRVFLEKVRINPPKCTVMSNVSGRAHGSPEEIKRAMVAQIISPVKWIDCIREMEKAGVNCYVECGPGRVLSGLVKRIQPPARLGNVQDNRSLQAARELLGSNSGGDEISCKT
ncbi:MAG: ACP S-malonyltransferase [Kiritimatiellae bacterium]|nr:ACP S-malonyltransferase [Kiritimatiellia bacterium]